MASFLTSETERLDSMILPQSSMALMASLRLVGVKSTAGSRS
jgi:hypothetical protein